MSGSPGILIELLLVLVAIGWGVRELWLLRRDRRDAARRAAGDARDPKA